MLAVCMTHTTSGFPFQVVVGRGGETGSCFNTPGLLEEKNRIRNI